MGKTGGGRGTNQHAVKGRSLEDHHHDTAANKASAAAVHDAATSEFDATALAQAGDNLPASQQDFIRNQPDTAFREMGHVAVRTQRTVRSGMTEVTNGDDGETAAYVITEMADRGLDDDLNEILEPDAGAPATDYTVTTHQTDGTARKAAFGSPSEAVLFAHERHSAADPSVNSVTVSSHNEGASRTVLEAHPTTGLRFVLPPPGSEMSDDDAEREIQRLEGRLNAPDSLTRRRVTGRLDDLYRRELA